MGGREIVSAEYLQEEQDHRNSQLILSRQTCELCLALGLGLAGGMLLAWATW